MWPRSSRRQSLLPQLRCQNRTGTGSARMPDMPSAVETGRAVLCQLRDSGQQTRIPQPAPQQPLPGAGLCAAAAKRSYSSHFQPLAARLAAAPPRRQSASARLADHLIPSSWCSSWRRRRLCPGRQDDQADDPGTQGDVPLDRDQTAQGRRFDLVEDLVRIGNISENDIHGGSRINLGVTSRACRRDGDGPVLVEALENLSLDSHQHV